MVLQTLGDDFLLLRISLPTLRPTLVGPTSRPVIRVSQWRTEPKEEEVFVRLWTLKATFFGRRSTTTRMHEKENLVSSS